MNTLSRYPVLIILILPLLLSSIFSSISTSVTITVVLKFAQVGLLCLWFYSVIKFIRLTVGISEKDLKLVELLLIVVLLSPFVRLIAIDGLRIVLLMLTIIAGFGVIFLTAVNFEKVLSKNKISFDRRINVLSFFIWPIAVWRFQDLIKNGVS